MTHGWSHLRSPLVVPVQPVFEGSEQSLLQAEMIKNNRETQLVINSVQISMMSIQRESK